MSSTTMRLSPGLPIMKTADLVNWSMASYAYETLADNKALRLKNGKNATVTPLGRSITERFTCFPTTTKTRGEANNFNLKNGVLATTADCSAGRPCGVVFGTE